MYTTQDIAKNRRAFSIYFPFLRNQTRCSRENHRDRFLLGFSSSFSSSSSSSSAGADPT
jgi:hypothetical protein